MNLAIVHSRAKSGIEAPEVTVEVHLSNGLPSLSIVGLPETAVKESKDRVRSAILNAHLEFPARRITINLAPADLPKEGGRFDLPIAIGILAASGQIPTDELEQYEFLGELALSGELRGVNGILPAAIATGGARRQLVLPAANAPEASLSSGTTSLPAKHLLEVCAHLHNNRLLDSVKGKPDHLTATSTIDLADVIGQHQAKRALEIAAAGGHNLLFSGPPGTGKTMLASRLPTILPNLTEPEALEVAAIHSVANSSKGHAFFQRPFRSPHHTASPTALVGGGSNPKPGEISLAHHGILFLDELPEFPRKALEVMREPLESGEIVISRANAQTRYPANFQLVAAMNPCPCGFLGEPRCCCSADQINRYRSKISGPLLDRIDLQVQLAALPTEQLTRPTQQQTNTETSEQIKQRVNQARERQLTRSGKINAALTNPELKKLCSLTASQYQWLESVIERLGLSARSYHRVLKVARTIADLAGVDQISDQHLSEAVGYRLTTE